MASNPSLQDIPSIDKEIRVLENRIARLRTVRNTLIPIGRLPPDILERIFHLGRRQGFHTIHLSWVSHAWRSTTLGSKSLWAFLNNSNLQWLSIYLERSSPAPLVIHFQEPFVHKKLFIKSLRELSRIKALVLPRDDWGFLVGPIIRDMFSQHGSSPLPNLNLLRLNGITLEQDMHVCLQNVRYLSFGWCTFDWSARPSFPSLRSLSITIPDVHIALPTLLNALGYMPRLEQLVLSDAIAPVSSPSEPVLRRTFPNGPKLAYLKLENGELETDMTFLQTAGAITQDTCMSLSLYRVRQPLSTLKEVFDTFGGWAASMGHTQGVTHLGLDGNTLSISDILTVEYGTTGESFHRQRGFVNLAIVIPPHIRQDFSIVKVVHDFFPFHNLNALWIDIPDSVDTQAWQRIIDTFGFLPQLQHLAISTRPGTRSIQPLLNMMSMEHSPNVDAVPPCIPFHALTTLLLPYCSPFEEELYALLQSRRSAGLRLQTLGLARGHDAEKLQRLTGGNIVDLVGGFVDGGGKDHFAKQEHYGFLARVPPDLETLLDIL